MEEESKKTEQQETGELPQGFRPFIGQEEETLPSARPMTYRELSNGYEEEREDQEESLLFPPFSPIPKKNKGWYILKSLLWVGSVVLLSCVILLIFSRINRESPEKNEKPSDKIPDNTVAPYSYAEEASLPDAPQASADPEGPQISVIPAENQSSDNAVHRAYRKAAPSVVSITSYEGGTDYVLNKLGSGSGIILSADGYIATNSHVVNDSISTGVMITTFDGSQYLGTIIGVDPKTDLAVLKIDGKEMIPAEFADSDSLFVGQEVYAIGSPGGANFSNSLTHGTVSAVNRMLSSNGYVRYVQTDAAINPGNSGGALINDKGQVVGMNTSKIVSTNYEGMGFAIPSNKVQEIVNKLIRHGYINDRGTLHIEGTTCNLYESKRKNVPCGMVITKIDVGSPLITTEAEEKDIIIAINGKTVKSAYEFLDELGKFKPGDEVTLTLFRSVGNRTDAYTFDVKVVLVEDTIDAS